MNLSKIQEIFSAYRVMVDPTTEQSAIAAKRLETCHTCPFLKETGDIFGKIKVCGKCGCVLKAKVFVPEKTACPENKWEI
ncbi:MAG: hypothetical protein RL377_1545 [Bacteroidota bacterium]|jgi:hypothetical protein